MPMRELTDEEVFGRPDLSAIDPGAVAAGQGVPSGPRINIGGARSGELSDDDVFGPQQRTTGQELGRQAGLAGRYAIEGAMMLPSMIGDAANAATNLGIRGVNKAFGTNVPELGTVTEAVTGGLDRMGVPRPENPTERVVGEASRALASVPTFAAGALSTGARALQPLAEKMGLQATSAMGAGAGYGAAKEAFPDNPAAQAVAGLAGGMAGGLRAAEPMADVARRSADFARSGVAPSVQDVTQGNSWQRLGKLLENIPFSSDVVKTRELERLRQAEAAANRIAAGYGTPGTPQRIGEQVQRGVEQFRFGKAPANMSPSEIIKSPTRDSSIAAKANALYNQVPIRPESELTAGATLDALRGAATKYSNPDLNTEFAVPLIERLAPVLEKSQGRMTWGDLRQLRTDLRYMRSKASLDPTMDDRVLSQLDDALGRDMLVGAKEIGGQSAVDAIMRADRYYAQQMQGVTEKLKTIFNSNRPEQVFTQIESALSAKPNRADLGKLRQLRKALPKEAWDDIAATIVDGLGKPSAAGALPPDMPQFSAAQFVRRFGDMSPEARTILFDGAGKGDLRGSLEALYRVAASMKNTDRLANVSQSGNMIVAGGTGAGLIADPITTLTALGAANVTARAMYNPTFVRLWTQSLRANTPATRQQAALQATRFAQQNPELAEDVSALLRSLVPARAEQNEQNKRGPR